MARMPNTRDRYEYLEYTMTTTGFTDLEKVLVEMQKDFGAGETTKKVLVPALRQAFKPALSTARAFILAGPYNEKNTTSKHMLDTLRLTARMPNNKDKRSAYLVQNDVAMAEVSVLTDDRGMSQEFGNARVPAQPFLRRALEFSATACIDQFQTILVGVIQKYKSKNTKDNTNELSSIPKY